MPTLIIDEKEKIIDRHGANPEKILNILIDLQFASPEGYIDQETAQLVADRLHMKETRVYEIISFYAILKDTPQARYTIKVCSSSPCHFSGGTMVMQSLEKALGVKENEATDDNLFMYHGIPCVGACGQGPVIKIKDTVFGNLNPAKIEQLVKDLRDGRYPEL